MQKMKAYYFVVRYWDIPSQKFKTRTYLKRNNCEFSILPIAKEFVSWFKGLPGVRNVTLTVCDLDMDIVAEV